LTLVAIVDIGGRQTGIYIFDGKKLHLVREIMTASESFTDVLISGFGLTSRKLKAYTREKGFDETSSDILAVPMERLAARYSEPSMCTPEVSVPAGCAGLPARAGSTESPISSRS